MIPTVISSSQHGIPRISLLHPTSSQRLFSMSGIKPFSEVDWLAGDTTLPFLREVAAQFPLYEFGQFGFVRSQMVSLCDDDGRESCEIRPILRLLFGIEKSGGWHYVNLNYGIYPDIELKEACLRMAWFRNEMMRQFPRVSFRSISFRGWFGTCGGCGKDLKSYNDFHISRNDTVRCLACCKQKGSKQIDRELSYAAA